VGDTLDLHFYSSSWRTTNNLSSAQAEVGTPKVTSIYGPQKEDHPEAFSAADPGQSYAVNDGLYTIVGIYGGSSWQDDYRYMHPNTVIVPQNSLVKSTVIRDQYDLCYSLLIPNGAIDAVEEEMIAQGYGDRLAYYDGGYSVIMPNVKSIYDSAVFVNAIASGQRVILADEPTGNLDSENSDLVMKTFQRLAHEEGYCIIIVTHDPQIADESDVVIRMDSGRIVSADV
jgi:hypothetical protein